jgi:hypothetical protein
MKIPQHGDLRVCYVMTAVPDHGLSIDVPDLDTAKFVYDAIVAVHVGQIDHHIHNSPASVSVQIFDEDTSWREVHDLREKA